MTRLVVSFCLLGAAIYAADALVPPPIPTVASIEPAPTQARQLRSWGTTLSNLPLGHKRQLASNAKPDPLPPQQRAAVEDQLATVTDSAEQRSAEWTKVATAAKVHKVDALADGRSTIPLDTDADRLCVCMWGWCSWNPVTQSCCVSRDLLELWPASSPNECKIVNVLCCRRPNPSQLTESVVMNWKWILLLSVF